MKQIKRFIITEIMISSRFAALSSSILLIRPFKTSHKLDFQILFVKRTAGLYAGGSYAFPGGQVEEQDYRETWEQVLPGYVETTGRHYHDFNKRIGGIRELYEECNLLIARHPKPAAVQLSPDVRLKTLETKYEGRFPQFCRDFDLHP